MKREFGDVPGYEFEAPRVPARTPGYGTLGGAQDPLRALRAAEEPRAPSLPARVAASLLDVLRERNLLTNLAMPIVAAIIVGVAAVVVAGGGGRGGAAPSALAAGFPPARLAGADFTGAGGAGQPVLASIAASAATDVVAGSVSGHPALWVSPDGGSAWSRPDLTGPAAPAAAGGGQLTGVAHGTAGWLAVGSMAAGQRGPLAVGSPDGQAWTATALPGAAGGAVAAAVAAGPAGYAIVGRQAAGGGSAAAWYSRGLDGWQPAAVAPAGPAGGAMMAAVTVTAGGFAAVGSAGTRPAAWISAAGRSWRPAPVPLPAGAARAALDYVAARGMRVVAAGTEVSAAGASRPFTVVSADAGATWTLLPLPAPAAASGAAAVTALTAAGGGFIAAGTFGAADGTDVVIWMLPAGQAGGPQWTVSAPRGTGLSGPGTQTLTALTAEGTTLTGVGFTARGQAQQPTLWQSPVRY